jgi:hypothetical protein
MNFYVITEKVSKKEIIHKNYLPRFLTIRIDKVCFWVLVYFHIFFFPYNCDINQINSNIPQSITKITVQSVQTVLVLSEGLLLTIRMKNWEGGCN